MSSAPEGSVRKALAGLTADKIVALTIVVGALGYFVDVFDLLLFSIVRVQSVQDIGVAEPDRLAVGINLLNIQMAGLLTGGIVWGILGDRFGRLSVLFGSILMYSVANIGNAFVHTVFQYGVARFITGFGLAGELGVGVTLASELLPKTLRGLGTTFIATVGVLGASAAATISASTDWRVSYAVGGVMGLVLLVLRMKVRESGMYRSLAAEKAHVSRGNFLLLFARRDLLVRYLAIIFIGAPIWGMIGLFITFTPEFAADLGLSIQPSALNAVLYCYIGTMLGQFLIGTLSQYLESRRKAIAVSLVLLIFFMALFVTLKPDTLFQYYLLCGLMGIGAGYWAMFVQVGAEQFGTNLRATTATSVPNFVRGLTIPITLAFRALIPAFDGSKTQAGLAVMAAVLALAFWGLWIIRETFHAELDYVEA